MNWWDSRAQSAPADGLSAKPAKASRQQTGSDGIREIAPNDSEKLLPLPKALQMTKTPLSQREVSSLMHAYQESVNQSNSKPLLDWFAQHKVREIAIDTSIPEGNRYQSTPLNNRSVRHIHDEKIQYIAMQLISHLIRPKTFKEASGNTSSPAKMNPAISNKRRRKSGKKGDSEGESNFIMDKENAAPVSVNQKEVDDGIDSIRSTPDILLPKD